MAIHSCHFISFLPIMSYLVILIFAAVALSCLNDPDPEQNRNFLLATGNTVKIRLK